MSIWEYNILLSEYRIDVELLKKKCIETNDLRTTPEVFHSISSSSLDYFMIFSSHTHTQQKKNINFKIPSSLYLGY